MSLWNMPQNRIVMHIDMNAFFASVEQSANKFIRNLPVAVGNPHYENTTLVAVSYEARQCGVSKLSRGKLARQICPELIIVPFDPLKYYTVNQQIVSILREYTSQVEVYSIDEAFMDFTHLPKHLQNREISKIAQEIQQRIVDEVGVKLFSSVGIAPNKLLAKVASNWKKPNGMTIISWKNRLEYLDKLKLDDIWGIGRLSAPKLQQLGIRNTKDLRQIDDAALRSVVGSYYTRLRMIANGEHYDPITPNRSQREAKSMQHAHTLSKATSDITELKSLIRKQAERLARRLRNHHQMTKLVYLGLKESRQAGGYGWGSSTRYADFKPINLSNHGQDIYTAAVKILDTFILDNTPIRQIVLGVDKLQNTSQLMLDTFQDKLKTALDSAADKINAKYGNFTLRSADILYQYAKERELSVDKEAMVFHPE